MFKIDKMNSADYEAFRKMFLDYFMNDLDVKYDKDKLRENLINKTILPQYEQRLIFIDIVKQDEECLGFIIYQVDKEESDWKERIGAGFIREFYIKPNARRKGIGTLLLQHAECCLKRNGTKEVYLTCRESDAIKNFYKKCGYQSNHKCLHNGNEYFEKSL